MVTVTSHYGIREYDDSGIKCHSRELKVQLDSIFKMHFDRSYNTRPFPILTILMLVRILRIEAGFHFQIPF